MMKQLSLLKRIPPLLLRLARKGITLYLSLSLRIRLKLL